MKSVVAEASSIAKAIELAWQKAGQPKEFLIKVFQEPQRNIFGLTKTSAKVGIFFDDAALVQKIKTASQNTIPVANHNLPKSANNNPPSKQISPIKPLNTKNVRPQVQAPRQPKPVIRQQPIVTNPAPAVSQVLNQTPIVEPIVAPVNLENTNSIQTNNQNLNSQTSSSTESPRTTPRKKYYRRRKPRTPRPNDNNNGNINPTGSGDKNEG